MASKNFAINTEPHVATIGNVQLRFQPEVIGSEFASAYAKLVDAQQKVNDRKGAKASSTKHGKAETVDPATLVELNQAMREFLSGLMLPDSQKVFETFQVPDRILVELLQWTSELYGGGSGNADAGGSSTG